MLLEGLGVLNYMADVLYEDYILMFACLLVFWGVADNGRANCILILRLKLLFHACSDDAIYP